MSAFVPVGRRASFWLQTSQVTATGDDLETLSGFGDTQAGVTYTRPLGEGSLVSTLNVNLPSGKRELTRDEFTTSILLSQTFFDFRIPGFGQGTNVSPSLTWAVPVQDDVVVGVGASYQYRGSFRPVQFDDSEYDPGDEMLVTGGIDLRLGRTEAVSGDVSYTLYTDDSWGTQSFSPGNKVVASLQYLSYMGFDELRVQARYSSRAKTTLPVGAGLTSEAQRLTPTHLNLLGTYRWRFSRDGAVRFLAQGRFFGEAEPYEAQNVVDVGMLPEWSLADALHLQGRFVYTAGSFSGLEAGVGLVTSW